MILLNTISCLIPSHRITLHCRAPRGMPTLATTPPRTPPPPATTPLCRPRTTSGRWVGVCGGGGGGGGPGVSDLALCSTRFRHYPAHRHPPALQHMHPPLAGHQGDVGPDLGRRPRLLPGQLALCPPELGRRHGLGLGAVAGAGEEEKWMVGPPWTHAPPPCTEQLGCCPVVPPSQESKEATGQTWDDAKRQAYQQWKSSSGAAQQVRARGDSHGAGPAACRHCMCPLHVPAVSQSWGIGATNKHVCRLVVRTPP